MDQINKALLNQLTQKIGVMKGMQMSDEEIEKSFDKSELDLIEKAMGNRIEKSKSFPVGTIHNGFKKISEGKWMKVSEHGKTKKEHEVQIESTRKEMISIGEKTGGKSNLGSWRQAIKNNEKAALKLDDKEYSDEDVHGSGDVKVGDKIKVEGKKPGFFVSAKITGIKNDMISYETEDGDSGNLRKDSNKLSLKD